MTDDIDNDGTTLHESGGVVQPTDAQIDAIAEAARRSYFSNQASLSKITPDSQRVWRGVARAVLALAVPQAPLQAEPVPVVASEPDECPHGEAHIVHDCLRCGAPVCCGKCCAEDTDHLATPQAEPAAAEQARDGKDWVDELPYGEGMPAMKAAIRAALASQSTPPPESEPDFDECECGYGCPPGCGCRHSGESTTPPPESAGQGLSDAEIDQIITAVRSVYGGWVNSSDKAEVASFQSAGRKAVRAILAANPTAQPDGGSKA